MTKKQRDKKPRQKSKNNGIPPGQPSRLKHQRLERRRLLNADFGFDGSTLQLDNFTDSTGDPNNILVSDDGTHFTFKLSDGLFSGTDTAKIMGNNLSQLTVDKSLAGLVEIIFESNTSDQFNIIFDDFSFDGSLGVTQAAGAASFDSVSQVVGSSLVNKSTFTLAGDDLNVELANSGNNFSFFQVDASVDVDLHDTDEIKLGKISASDGIKISTGGDQTIAGEIGNSSGGVIEIDSQGDIVIANKVSNVGDISISSTQDVIFEDSGYVSTSGASTITIAAQGSILDSSASEDAQLVSETGAVRLSATVGIGTNSLDGDIDAKITNLQFKTDGGIYFSDLDNGLDIYESSQALGGGEVAADSPLTISANIKVGASATFTAGDSPTLDDDLTIRSGATVFLTGSSQTLTFNAGDDVIFDTGRIITSGNDNVVVLNADTEGAVDADRGSVSNSAGALPTITTDTLRISAADGIGDSSGDAGTISSESLRIDVDNLSATNLVGNQVLISEANNLKITGGGVGISNANANVKLTVGGNLTISDAISIGTGSLFLDVDGNVSQDASITAAGLGLMVDGTTTLQNDANDIATLAASNGDTTYYTDANGFAVGTVSVEGMMVSGITTSDDAVKLTAVSNLKISESINLGTGSLFLDVGGNVTQGASITAAGLGLMVDGTTTLTNASNNVATFAADNGDTTLYVDIDGFTVGSVTVEGMTVTGVTTSDDDVKLTAGGDLAIDAAIALGSGDLFLDVAGNVTQTASITAAGLGLMVDGTTTLTGASNNVATFAADNDDTTLYVDIDGFTVDSVTVDGMTVTGITTTDDDTKLTSEGDLAIDSAVTLGSGNLFLDVAGNVTQTVAVKAAGLGLMVDGTTTLTNASNNVATFAADNDDTTLYVDIDGFTVGNVTVDGMTVTGITKSDDDVKLTAGGDLAIDAAVALGSGDLFLDVAGNLTQSASITAAGLGLMVDGTTTLTNASNNVATFAADNGDTTLYVDIDGFTVGSVTVDGMTATGITTSDDDVKLTAGGDLAIDAAVALGSGDLFLDVAGNLTQSASITAAGLGLMVDGTTTLTNASNNVTTLAADNGDTTLYVDIDGFTVGSVTFDGMTVTGITTSDDDVKLTAGGDLVIDAAVALGSGDLLLDVAGNVTQTASMTAAGLGLMVDGTTTLTNAGNNVATFAADNGDTTLYVDVDGFTVGSVTVDGMTVTGITTSDDDVKLTAGGDLAIDAAVALGSGDLFLDVAGNVTQTASITAAGLGLMVDGTTTLTNAGNNVATFAADNGGTTLYVDIDAFTVGSVTVDGMTVTGITTSDDDVKLMAGGDLAIDAAVALGSGNLFLDVAGDVTQTASITAAGLGLMVDGTTTLTNASNNVATFAADNGDTTLYVDVDGFTVGSVTVDGMTVTGITTTDDDVKLTAGGDLAIDAAVALGLGDLFLDVAGNVTQTASITVAGLGLMVDGTTMLTNASNNIAIFAADNGDTTLYVDVDGFTVDSVTVDGMTVTGITTTDDDVKLTAGGNLAIDAAVALGSGDLFLDVVGNVTQTASITAAGLGLMVDGTTTLTNASNNVATFATDNGDTTLYVDVDGFTVGSVTVDGMTVTGITTSDDDVKLTAGGDLAIDAAVALGSGDLFLDVTGNVTQTASITAAGLGLMVDGTTTFTNASNNVAMFAADNGDTTLYVDIDGVTVGSVTVNGMTITGITTSDDDVKLTAGGDLAIDAAVALGSGDLFLDVTGNVTQTASITAAGLGLMVDGTTTLTNASNNVAMFAADNGDTTLYVDIDGFTVGSVTVDGMTVTGITTSDDDVKLTAGGDLAIDAAVALGSGSLFLDVAGNVTQTAPITAAGLGLMVDGTTTLTGASNNVATFAADNGGTTLYVDIDGFTVGSVTVDGMTVTGITTSDDDVKLTAGGDLAIDAAVALGLGDLFLDVAGNVTQTASITAAGLGLMVDGTTTLTSASNNVATFAADNGDTTLYVDVDGFTVGSVTVDGMTVTGITTSDDDVKLTAGGDLAIDAAVALGSGDLFLDVAGNVTQTASITAAGLGLMVDGTTTLTNASNNVATFAADNGDTTLYVDVDGFTVGSVTVDGMTVTGITTSDDDVKLTAGGDLAIDAAVTLGSGDLFLDVAGNVTQTASITAAGLGLMVDDTSTLTNASNNVATFAADNGDTTLYVDIDGFTVGSVTVDGMTVTGITTSDDDVKLKAGGDLAIGAAVTVGSGDLFLDVAGNVTQTASITAAGLGLMVDGTSTLTNASNNVATFAADNGDTTLYVDIDGFTVGSVTVDGMTVTGISTSDDDVKLKAGGDLAIGAAVTVGSGDLFLDVAGNVTQTASITAAGLGLMVDGTTMLTNASNNVATFSADNGGTTLYVDIDGFTVGSVTVDGMTVTGITTSDDDVKLTAGGDLAIDAAVTLGSGNLFLDVAGNVTQTASITAAGLGLMVDGTTTLTSASNNVATFAADNGDTTLYVDVDGFTVGNVTVDGMTVTGITTSDDDVKLTAGGDLAIDAAVALGSGNLFLDVTGNVTQSASITAAGLGLMVDGTTTLTNPSNNVATFAADNGDTTLYVDVDGFTVGSVTVDGMTVTGITTSNDDVKLTAGGDLAIDAAVALGSGDLFLDVAGNVTQTASITAAGLGLMVDGTTTLTNASNNVATFAADNGDTTLYVDVDGFTVGSVTVDGMTVTGITTSDDDVKLTAGGDLAIDAAVALGSGDLFLDVAGNVTQTASITAAGLGLMVDGTTTLTNASNNVATFAADNGDTTLYVDVDGFTVGSVTVDGMTVTGITTSDDDVMLTAGGDLAIDAAVILGLGDLFLDVAGNVTQTASITAAGLGLMVDGTTMLINPSNNIAIFAADNGDTTLYVDVDGFTVGSVTVDGMTVTGITTSDDDVKLTAGGDLAIDAAVALGSGDLFLDVAGNVTQTASITAAGLGLMVDGTTTLTNASNNVATFAADNGGTTLYVDIDGFTVGSVTVDGMTVTGITTSDDDVKLTAGGDLAIDAAVALGSGSLFLDVAGNVTQTASITAAGLGLMVDGTTTLTNASNNVATFAADNGDKTLYVDIDGFTVGSVTVDGMTVTGITTSDDDVKLTAGGDLAIDAAVALGLGDLFLDVAGNVTQTASITAAGLGLMVDGTTTLTNASNNVATIAADNGDTTLYVDADGFTVGSVTVDGMTVTGITTSDDDVKLTAGGDLAIDAAIALGAGNLLLDVSGDLTQMSAITAAGLGLMVDGMTTLQNAANDIDIFAAENIGATLFTDASGLTIGSVIVDGMTIKGVTIASDFGLTAGGNIDQATDAPIIVSGLTEVMTTGYVCWTFGDCIDGDGNPMADGINDNDFNSIKITGATNADIVDRNGLTVVSATVDSRLRLSAGDSESGNLRLDGDLTTTDQILLQASDGISQVAGVITTRELLIGGDLAKESTGLFDLQSENVVNEIAAQLNGELLFKNSIDLDVGVLDYSSICGSQQSIAGINVTGDFKVVVDASANADAGHLTQSPGAPVIVTGSANLDATGKIVWLGDDRNPADGGNANDFQGTVNVNQDLGLDNVERDYIEIADIDGLIVENARANDGIHLYSGTNAVGQMSLTGEIASNQVLLQSSGGVLQDTTTGVVDASELIAGGDQINEGSGAFILQGANEIDSVVAAISNGSIQLNNLNALTVSSGLSFIGSDGMVTDAASGISVDGAGSLLVFADPNVLLAETVQGTIGNGGQRFNPAFGIFFDTTDSGVVVRNENLLTVEAGAAVTAGSSDVYLTTVGDHDLQISDTIRVENITNRILVVAGAEFILEPEGQLERGNVGLINSRFNDLVLQDPTGDPANQNQFVDRNFLTQDVQLIFGDAGEADFDSTIFWGIEGKNDNTFDFGSLNATQLAALETLLFGGGANNGFESRSFYDDEVTNGATSVTLTSQPIGAEFDNSGTVSDATFIPTASFTLDFLRTNAEFRNVVFIFNDANINMFQNASQTNPDGSSAIEDLNVATADFEGLARFQTPIRILVTRPDVEIYTQVDVIPQTEVELIDTTFYTTEPIFVQTVQQKFYVIVYFESQFEADQFEILFGDEERDYEEVQELLEKLQKDGDVIVWRDATDEEIDNLDANQIREVLNRAGLDLEDDEQWVDRFKAWLRSSSAEENVPDIPRGVFKILEVDNGKTIIQGDDIDRKFVPEPSQSSEDGEQSEQPQDNDDSTTSPPGNALYRSEDSSRIARWSAILHGEELSDSSQGQSWRNEMTPWADKDATMSERSAEMLAAPAGMASLLGLLSRLRKNQKDCQSEKESAIDKKLESPDRNLFSRSSRFVRRSSRSKP